MNIQKAINKSFDELCTQQEDCLATLGGKLKHRDRLERLLRALVEAQRNILLAAFQTSERQEGPTDETDEPRAKSLGMRRKKRIEAQEEQSDLELE